MTNVAIHCDNHVYLKDIIDKLQDQIDIKPFLSLSEPLTNETIKLKNNLATDERQLITFQKKFNKYVDLKNNIESFLKCMTSTFDNVSSNQEVLNQNVRIYYYFITSSIFVYLYGYFFFSSLV